MKPSEWLTELQAISARQITEIRAELLAEAEQVAQAAQRSAVASGGAITSAVVTQTPDGARVTVQASSTGERMVTGALRRAAVREADAVAAPLLSTDGMVLSQ